MFDCGTRGRFLRTLSPQNSTAEPCRGWFLRMTVGSPVPREKKIPARCTGTCAPSLFPQLTTLTNEHQRSESQLTGM